MDYKLVNAVKRAAENPDTFHIPDIAERYAVQPGDSLKVAMEDSTGENPGERFWVTVVRFEDLRIIAAVDNPLVFVPFDLWEEIEIAPEHIMDIVRA